VWLGTAYIWWVDYLVVVGVAVFGGLILDFKALINIQP
jgi:hypothetical protein